MKLATKAGKQAVANEKALTQIAKAGGDDIQAVAQTSTGVTSLENAKDITRQFMAPKLEYGPSLYEGKISMYKGLIKGLPVFTDRIAMLAGEKNTVYDAITAASPQDVLQNEDVQLRWKQLSYVPLGVAVLNATKSAKEYALELQALELSNPTLLLVMFRHGSNIPQCYEIADSDCSKSSSEPTIEMIPICLRNLSENRKKGNQYSVLPVEKIGVSIQDEAEALVYQAIKSHIATAISSEPEPDHDSSSHQHSDEKIFVVAKPVPADGMCFFHAVLASMHTDAYNSIPRKDSGYPVNQRQQQLEESSAKSLLNAVLERADQGNSDEDVARAANLRANSSVNLTDVDWIARKLGLGIRCTLDEKAFGLKKIHVHHVPFFAYT